MKLYLSDITDQETVVSATESDSWVAAALPRPEGAATTPPAPASTNVLFKVRNVDDVLILTGRIQTTVELLCSRCATTFLQPLQTNFTSLYSADPVLAGVGYLSEKGEVSGHTHGVAMHAHIKDKSEYRKTAAESPESDDEIDDPDQYDGEETSESSGNLDITFLQEDYLDLTAVISEQVAFETPFQPLCRENCKGICAQCGADLNASPCNCAPISKNLAFDSLKNFKLKSQEKQKE